MSRKNKSLILPRNDQWRICPVDTSRPQNLAIYLSVACGDKQTTQARPLSQGDLWRPADHKSSPSTSGWPVETNRHKMSPSSSEWHVDISRPQNLALYLKVICRDKQTHNFALYLRVTCGDKQTTNYRLLYQGDLWRQADHTKVPSILGWPMETSIPLNFALCLRVTSGDKQTTQNSPLS